jgi:dephospho-CoA kinase
MLRVALTGGIATGKTYVLDRLRERGVACLDADELAHGVTASGTEAASAIAERFGPDILAPDGSVDRTRLGPIVFEDARARADLEAIMHPGVYRAIEAGLRGLERVGATVAVVAIPLLDESGGRSGFQKVIATVCEPELQVSRLVARGLSERAARARLAAQLPAAEKAARADFVIRTDGTFEDTDRQIAAIVASLAQRPSAGVQP